MCNTIKLWVLWIRRFYKIFSGLWTPTYCKWALVVRDVYHNMFTQSPGKGRKTHILKSIVFQKISNRRVRFRGYIYPAPWWDVTKVSVTVCGDVARFSVTVCERGCNFLFLYFQTPFSSGKRKHSKIIRRDSAPLRNDSSGNLSRC